MHCAMLGLVTEGIDVAEIYSPPRVTQYAATLGLRPSWTLDITNHDTDGEAWDFSKAKVRRSAMENVRSRQTVTSNWQPHAHRLVNDYEFQLGQDG